MRSATSGRQLIAGGSPYDRDCAAAAVVLVVVRGMDPWMGHFPGERRSAGGDANVNPGRKGFDTSQRLFS